MEPNNEAPTFLVVDDDPNLLAIAEAMFGALQCGTKCVSNGKEALALLEDPKQARQFDAIFLDIMMPEMSGLEVLIKLKGRPHTVSIPVVMITCQTSYKEIMNGYSSGADYYITKPFTQEQLVYALDIVMGENAGEKRHFLPEA